MNYASFRGEGAMDLLMIFGTIAFFVIAIAYTRACDRLK